jgi:hypothetical protein
LIPLISANAFADALILLYNRTKKSRQTEQHERFSS